MRDEFAIHNTHLQNPANFSKLDPQLRGLASLTYIHEPELLHELPTETPGIYTLGGGRQIGKSTLLKQFMQKLLKLGKSPNSIRFISGEMITDGKQLFSILRELIETMPDETMRYIIIDEITYIPDWDQTVKYVADAGWLENTELILTGSELVLIQEARMRFPGRRGKADKVDFHLYPLSFYETFTLTQGAKTTENPDIEALFSTFENYLIHGGFLTAINEFASTGLISRATLHTYSDWIRGDFAKRNKQETYLREVIQAIIKRYGTQLTWNSLASTLSIDHPKTIADYIHLLESMDAAFVQFALLEDKLVGAPKKARKVLFKDPFIYHALHAWIDPCEDSFEEQIKPLIKNPEASSLLVEAIVVSHYARYYPSYYIKAASEVDLAYIDKKKFWPIEIKWRNQLHPKDLKQILKYKNGAIFNKQRAVGEIQGIPTIPIPIALYELGKLHTQTSTIHY